MMDFLTPWSPRLLSVLRIMTGLLLLQHGTAKILGFPEVEMFAELDTLGMISGLLELIGGLLIVLGLFTRPVAFILAGEMAVAYFMAHAGGSFYPLVNMGELAVLYCFVFLYLAAAGPGPWSVDAMMHGNRTAPSATRY
jgi:putative oxidoreductase